jgi:hypothetical protein
MSVLQDKHRLQAAHPVLAFCRAINVRTTKICDSNITPELENGVPLDSVRQRHSTAI